ncbi:class I SAM-dependent methyltransferase [Jidongwangia harbinensis]|uniref:class I SAM-dependent methyltransferase n=1 Tax=Jidongwangia harbinensis TaxID=2878561 RepID=UPI001CD951A4|nr:class I SAM-dependent methyltransferase [Jidongwangia harbinensis]MCA2215139.1 class I SAM-dependent methyltransferase [Jidongwangia harbinensis]
MSSLVQFGRRQAVRLHSLTSRQAIGLGVMAVLCLGVTVASATGHAAVATSALALLLAATLAGVVHLSRRVRALHRADQAAVRDLRIVVEQLQRRLVAAVEKERLAAGDRHQEVLDAVARAERLTPPGAELLLGEQNREIEALVQLFQTVSPRAPMPAAESGPRPSDLLGLLHIVRGRKPKLVVALGAGPATIWLGYALESAGRLVVVEHDAEQAERSRALLRSHGLGAVQVLHAPLTELSLDGRTVDWYDVDALDGLHDIDLLVVDGPSATPADALPPALHVLGRRLASGAAVVIEEAARPEGRVAPRQWGFDGLSPERRLAGRYTALSFAPTLAPLPS